MGGFVLTCRIFSHTQESGRHQIVYKLLSKNWGVLIIGKLVTSNLLEQKAVVRFICIECPNHVVAISPGMLAIRIALLGIGVARQIQPVPRPALAVSR